MNRKISISVRSLGLILMVVAGIVFLGTKMVDDEEGYFIRNYNDVIKVTSEIDTETKNRVYQFRSVGERTMIVKITPFKYRPYLNEFDELPPELFINY